MGAFSVTDFPPLSESEVQAEKARHRVVKSIVTKLGIRQDFCVCAKLWPCPTIRLIAERERIKELAEEHLAEPTFETAKALADALAETGEKA